MTRLPSALVLVAFGALSAIAAMRHGYLGILEHQFQNLAGLQALTDLGIALTRVMIWMWRDAREHGRNVWPWIVLTLAAGSFGPLLYRVTARHG